MAADLNVGEKYSGRVININHDDLIVDIGNDYIGRVIDGGKSVAAEINTEIDVVVSEINDNGIILKLPSSDEPADGKAEVVISPWNDWNSKPSMHVEAVTALLNLQNKVHDYRIAFTDLFDSWGHKRDSARNDYTTESARINKSFEKEKKEYEDFYKKEIEPFQAEKDRLGTECNEQINIYQSITNRALSNLSSKKQQLTQLLSACENYVSYVRSTNVPEAIETAQRGLYDVKAKVESASLACQQVIDARKALFETEKAAAELKCTEEQAVYQKSIKEQQNILKSKIAEAERRRNEELNEARKKQISADGKSEHDYKEKREEVRRALFADIESGFNKSTIQTYQAKIRAAGFNALNYECPEEIPEFVMLGEMGTYIPLKEQDYLPIVEAVDLQAGKANVGRREGDKYVIKIPYAQSLSDGISLLVRYTSENKKTVSSMIQPLLLKLFLSFPAGKIEATMIDPLELGASFPDISKLVPSPNFDRIIDTKVWSKDKDIEKTIATLRQDLEKITRNYGSDQASRLKKESIRVLAITDFPVNFTEAALKDLQAIVRNSASLGVCVFIFANNEELEDLKHKNASLVNEISQSVVETQADGNRLVLARNSELFIELDDMKEVLERKDKIIELYKNALEHAKNKVEPFDAMFDFDISDSNNWFMGDHSEIAIPIGIKGADSVVKMILGRTGGSTEHHALIAGMTGAGKSTFFHTLIMSTMISYSPDEVQMYLLDFKEGVEFNVYARYRLPSLRVVAINTEREFGLAVLKELSKELETRTSRFAKEGTTEINDYLKKPNAAKMPKLLLIFDEVQELFRSENRDDGISAECISLIQRLVTQGRACGIHVILACQDFNNCRGLESCFSQMAIRIAIQGSVDGASSILKSDNTGILSLQKEPAGAAIYNGNCGEESANNFFQISYLKEEERKELLYKMDAYYADPDVASLFEGKQTRVLLSNAEHDIHNCFNKLIVEGPGSIKRLGSEKDGYGLLLGQGFAKKSIFIPEMRKSDGDNLLVVSRDENTALSLFEFAMMSVLYEELYTKADKTNALVYIIDLSDEELPDEACDFNYFESVFPQQVKVGKKAEAENIISSLYDLLTGRSEGTRPSDERIFFMFFGVNRARNLGDGGLYSDEREDDISPVEKLRKIMENGPSFGINSIIWGESRTGISNILGDRYEKLFNKRIAYGIDEESMDYLVNEYDSKNLQGKTAVYFDYKIDNKNTHFRPYDVPTKDWIEEYASAYNKAIREGGV